MAIIQHPLALCLPISDRALKSSGFLGPQLPAKPYHPLLTSLLCPEKQIWYSNRILGKSGREDREKQRGEEEEGSCDYVKTGGREEEKIEKRVGADGEAGGGGREIAI